ncbi:hypothetical protein GCM10009096_07270 [Parasphingorhabdus litoris]|uniref:Uncharacterized protein n=1 Tax=Parasphingorhabdus litoris TaxID=394733 RepID=A0ABN1A6V9_9SPHN|nr:hypothetical protein [Parasphingorhabdus litoris]
MAKPTNLSIAKSLTTLAGLLLGILLLPFAANAKAADNEIQNASFLNEIGGSTSIKKLGRGSHAVKAYIKRELPRVVGYRILKDKNKDPLNSATTARFAFERQCLAQGGYLEPQDSANNIEATEHFSKVVDGDGYTGVWKYHILTAVCSEDDENVIGGMGAIITDLTPLRRKHANHPLMIIGLMKEPNITTVFALDKSMFIPIAKRKRWDIERAEMMEKRRLATEAYDKEVRLERMARRKKFQSEIKLGTQTNCGMVIDMRGPLVEVQLPANISFDGQRRFWVAKAELSDDPPARNCSFGQ